MSERLNVGTSFSVYDLIDTSNIYNIFTERRRLLAVWCKTIEEAVIKHRLESEIYAGFQKVDYVKPVLDRYLNLSFAAQKVWIFGLPGDEIPELAGFNIVHLGENDLLAKEWFLVVDHPRYSRALVAQEITPPKTPHRLRMFRGVLTNDRNQVRLFAEALAETVGRNSIQHR